MEIDMSTVITNLDGDPLLKDTKVDKDEPENHITIGDVCINALLTPDQKSDGKERYDRFKLAQKIDKNGNTDLKVEEITKLKKVIGEIYAAPLVVGRAHDLLDPPKEEEGE